MIVQLREAKCREIPVCQEPVPSPEKPDKSLYAKL